METIGLTVKQIMQILPEIKSHSKFRILCTRCKIVPIAEKRVRHIISYLYSPDAVERLKNELAKGDQRVTPFKD